MRLQFLQKDKSKELILFFTGWGHCPNTLSQINLENYDVLVAYDYRNTSQNNEINEIIKSYSKTYLLAWSLGVFVANQLLQTAKLTRAIAINGSITPINNNTGIPKIIFTKTLQTLTPDSFKKFTNRMCSNTQAKNYYKLCQPKRTFEDQKQELEHINNWLSGDYTTKNIFDFAYISTNDTIFTIQNMKNAWSNLLKTDCIKIMETPHFPFYLYKNISEIITL